MRRVADLEQYVYAQTPLIGTVGNARELNKRVVPKSDKEIMHVSFPTKKMKQIVPAKVQNNISYDPNETGIDSGLVEDFNAWRVESRTDDRHSGLKIPCRMVGVVRSDWFDSLWNRHGWLNSMHMDALINLLLLNSKKDPARFGSGWAAVEMRCWEALCSDNHTLVNDCVGPYVVGLAPQTNPIHWAFANYVYGVGNVDGDHWVSYRLSFEERCITLYDSRSLSTSWESVQKLFKKVQNNIDRLCRDQHVWKIKGTPSDGCMKWRVAKFKHPPQLTNNFDCGIMAVKFIECLISGNPISSLDVGRCRFFRKYYSGKLFRASKVQPDVKVEDIGL